MSRCGLTPWECVIEHYAPALGARAGGNGTWTAKCPVCGSGRSLSITPKARNVLWHCNAGCGQDQVRETLAAKIPCVPRSPGRPPKTSSGEQNMTRDRAAAMLQMSPAAMKLELARFAWNCTPREAAGRMGMSRTVFYRAVTEIPGGEE